MSDPHIRAEKSKVLRRAAEVLGDEPAECLEKTLYAREDHPYERNKNMTTRGAIAIRRQFAKELRNYADMIDKGEIE